MKTTVYKDLLKNLHSGLLAVAGSLMMMSCGAAYMNGYSETDGAYYDPNKDIIPEGLPMGSYGNQPGDTYQYGDQTNETDTSIIDQATANQKQQQNKYQGWGNTNNKIKPQTGTSDWGTYSGSENNYYGYGGWGWGYPYSGYGYGFNYPYYGSYYGSSWGFGLGLGWAWGYPSWSGWGSWGWGSSWDYYPWGWGGGWNRPYYGYYHPYYYPDYGYVRNYKPRGADVVNRSTYYPNTNRSNNGTYYPSPRGRGYDSGYGQSRPSYPNQNQGSYQQPRYNNGGFRTNTGDSGFRNNSGSFGGGGFGGSSRSSSGGFSGGGGGGGFRSGGRR